LHGLAVFDVVDDDLVAAVMVRFALFALGSAVLLALTVRAVFAML